MCAVQRRTCPAREGQGDVLRYVALLLPSSCAAVLKRFFADEFHRVSGAHENLWSYDDWAHHVAALSHMCVRPLAAAVPVAYGNDACVRCVTSELQDA